MNSDSERSSELHEEVLEELHGTKKHPVYLRYKKQMKLMFVDVKSQPAFVASLFAETNLNSSRVIELLSLIVLSSVVQQQQQQQFQLQQKFFFVLFVISITVVTTVYEVDIYTVIMFKTKKRLP